MPTLVARPPAVARPSDDKMWDDPPVTTRAEDSWRAITRRLASAVILRAILDARNDYGGKDTVLARQFLQDDTKDMPWWCELAEMSVEQVRTYARERWPEPERVSTRPPKVTCDASIMPHLPTGPVEVPCAVRADPRWALLEPWARGIPAR